MSKPKLPEMSHQTLLITSRILLKTYKQKVAAGEAVLDPNAMRKLDTAIKNMEARQ